MVAVGNRGVDYLPRGANEIGADAKTHSILIVEKHLLLYYERDMRFYLAKRAALYQPTIEYALKAAETTGLKRRMIEQTFGPDIKNLNLAQRRRIRLDAPHAEQAN